MTARHSISFIALALTLAACAAPAIGTDPTTGDTVAPSTTAAPPETTQPPLTQPSEPEKGCSAAGLSSTPSTQDLPDDVTDTRAAIVAAATGCDVEGLAALAAPQFTYSFGGSDDPAGYWNALEAQTELPSPLTMLVRLLDLPFGVIETEETTYYVWPSAHAFESWEAVPQTDRDALLEVYGAQDLQDFAAFGAYVGYRVGITDEGEWVYFVAGD